MERTGEKTCSDHVTDAKYTQFLKKVVKGKAYLPLQIIKANYTSLKFEY
jgi:hypothetical protein